jgi:hypothetical protein
MAFVGPRGPDHPARRAEDVADGRLSTGAGFPASIDFDMFTVLEGRSELTLAADLLAGADGAPLVRFGSLHVM